MNLFAQWTSIAHTALSQLYPKIKLNQTRELLSTWVGHKTFASLKIHDLQIINEQSAKYIIVNNEEVLSRALRLGIPLTLDHWIGIYQKLNRSGVAGGFWHTRMMGMKGAACHVFEYACPPEKTRLWQQVGMIDGYRNTVVGGSFNENDCPLELLVEINSELLAFNQDESVFFPVTAQVKFKRVGNRIYEEGTLISFQQAGTMGNYDKSDDEYYEFDGIYD